MKQFFERLNESLKPVIREKFPGVVIGDYEDLTQEHETIATGLRLAPIFLEDAAMADSPQLLELIVNQIEDSLLNRDYTIQEFLFVKPIDIMGSGMYYMLSMVGKFKK